MGRRGRLLTLVDMVGKVMREVRFGRERIMVAYKTIINVMNK